MPKKSIEKSPKKNKKVSKKPKKITFNDINKEDFNLYIPKDFIERELTAPQCQFIISYIKQGFSNSYKAYKKSHPSASKSTCYVNGYRTLKIAKIQSVIRDYLAVEDSAKRIEIRKNIRDILYARATFDPGEIVNELGELKYNTLKEVPKEYRYCIENIIQKKYGKNATKTVIETSLCNRMESIKIYKDIFGDPTEDDPQEKLKGDKTTPLRMSSEEKEKFAELINKKKEAKDE
ncbi:MAG: terminase small subunit [Candidatus Hodarchaeota archaeon]